MAWQDAAATARVVATHGSLVDVVRERSATILAPSTHTSVTQSRSATFTRCDSGSKTGCIDSEERSTAIRSACLPGTSEPVIASRPSARAPLSVAIASAVWAGRAAASPVATLARRLARRISPRRSSRLFDAAPSVPSATFTPAASIAATGAMPLASFMLEAGQCTAWQPCAAMSAMSCASRCTQWMPTNEGPVTPRRSSRARSCRRSPGAILHLVACLREVRLDGQVELARIHQHPCEARIGNGVRGMRCEREREARCVPPLVARLEPARM